MCTHLSKRGSTYYFRRLIPQDVRAILDEGTEWVWSLRTKDRDEGKRRAQADTVSTNDKIADARQRLTTSTVDPSKEPDTLAFAITAWELEQADHDEREREEASERKHGRRHRRKQLKEQMLLPTEALSETAAAYRDIFRGEKRRRIEAEERALIARAELAIAKAALPLADPAPQAVPTAPVPVVGGMEIEGSLIDLWSVERSVRPRGVNAHRAVARWFIERTGRKHVAEVSRADVLAFKTALITEGQSAANIKVKLSRLRTLLQWAFENDHATLNAADGVTIRDGDASRNRRKEFDLDGLRTIFSSPVYTEVLRPAQGRGEAAYWLPLLALYTGARLEELSQLRTTDVLEMSFADGEGEERTAWIIRITEDAEAGLELKNAASERVVPIHPALQDLGFVRYVSATKDAGNERLFHELRPNTFGQLGAKWGEWFGRYKREVCGIRDRRMVFHSFRHTFKHYARHAAIVEGVQRQIMGHSSGDVADAYGSGYTVHQLVEGMKQFRVPGLELPLPPPAYR